MSPIRMALMAFCLGASLLAAPPSRPDVNKMVPEMMRMDLAGGKEVLAMWCPTQFFVAAGLATSPGLEVKDLEKDVEFLKDFTVFLVQVKVTTEDGTESLSTSALRDSAVLVDAKGRDIKPISSFPPKLDLMLSAMRTGMASNGASEMRILVFPARDAEGVLLATPQTPGVMNLKLRASGKFQGVALTWKTPLTAFVLPTDCRKCKEPLQAAWSFCPWCGESAGRK